jgi:hypothetical protein
MSNEPDAAALLREVQGVRQEDDDLIAWLRTRTHALNVRIRELQEENERLRQAAPEPSQGG